MEYVLYHCDAFRITRPDDWRLRKSGEKIGYIYNGRKFINDFEAKMLVRSLLKKYGAKNFDINVDGQIITITRKIQNSNNQ